jgi:hypothetical protein
MNPKINKAIDDIERTKAKIAELQALLPELERKRKDLEDAEIVRLVRSANVAPGDIAAFIDSIKSGRQDSRTNNGRFSRADNSGAEPPPPIKQEEASKNDAE